MPSGLLQRVRDRRECRRVRPLLQAFIDDQLDPTQRTRVARHLAACRRCGLDAQTYAALIDRLHRIGRPAHPDVVARLEAFVDDLMASDDGDEQRPTSG